ncbi:hypothetical protein [Actinotalea sp.]|uniref:hypothetical protein n=1 Tax=Actinotalea sp. TaxID=1872145 RepID=UPI00356441F3
MTPITYADLLTQAGGHVDRGIRQARARGFDTRDEARDALSAYHGLLAALEAHTWAIIGPARLTGASTGADPTERAAAAMADALRTATGARDPHPSQLTPPVHPWAHGALVLRAANDLLAGYHTPLGRPRSPDADAWSDLESRTASLAAVARVTGSALDVEDTLALRAAQAHLSWRETAHWLPGLTGARSLAAKVAASKPESAMPSRLSRLGLLGEPVRTDTPLHELTDRLKRLRHRAWDLQAHPDHSTATLRDLATLATAVHAHAAGHQTAPGADPARGATALLAHARDWQRVAHDLADYLSTGPPHAEIHADTRAVLDLLRQVAPLDGLSSTSGPIRRVEEDASVAAALRAAVAATEQIGQWAGHSFDRLAAHSELRVRATTLSRQQVTDDPELAAAKLTGGIVAAPAQCLAETRAAYTQANPPTAAYLAHHPTSPIEPSIEAMVIGRSL